MPNIAIPFCELHQINKYKDSRNINICRLCRSEKKKEYVENNKDDLQIKRRIYSQKTRERAKAWIENDRKNFPERYKGYAINARERNKADIDTNKIIKPYGLTVEQYKEMIVECDNKCEICGNAETRMVRGKVTRLNLDHCHETGRIRGLLCFSCNIAIGKFKDSIDLLQSAITYLKKHEATKNKPI